MATMKNVLITGAGGRIGRILRQALGACYHLSGIDKAPVPGFDSVVADLTDVSSMECPFSS